MSDEDLARVAWLINWLEKTTAGRPDDEVYLVVINVPSLESAIKRIPYAVLEKGASGREAECWVAKVAGGKTIERRAP
jgi:hypothetical protein